MVADYQSRTEERQAEMARVAQRVHDLKLRISSLRSDYAREASEGLKESAVRIVELHERLQPSEDAMRRQSIVAPVAGKVIGLRVHTEGGAIAPREPLMEILPENETLLIEAQASVDAIKELHVGQEVDIRFSALPYRTTPLVMGKLAYISPDALADEEGRPFFQVHVTPDPKSLEDARIDSLTPGMAAEIYIKTQSRTALEYLMKPITDSLLRAFRER
jgi:HlyD family type I secretion membrane fusion protein